MSNVRIIYYKSTAEFWASKGLEFYVRSSDLQREKKNIPDLPI